MVLLCEISVRAHLGDWQTQGRTDSGFLMECRHEGWTYCILAGHPSSLLKFVEIQ